MDTSKIILHFSTQLSLLQSQVDPDVWDKILQLEEELIQYHEQAVRFAYESGYLDGLFQHSASSFFQRDKP